MQAHHPFAELIDAACIRRGHSNESLARILTNLGYPVSGRAVGKWRTGESLPGIEYAQGLCRVLVVSAERAVDAAAKQARGQWEVKSVKQKGNGK